MRRRRRLREKKRWLGERNKKNIGKRTEQKRRLGGTGKGPAREKAEQGIVGQAEPGYGRAGENDGESGCEVRSEIKKWSKKDRANGKPALDFDSAGEYDIYKYRKPCKRSISNITMM